CAVLPQAFQQLGVEAAIEGLIGRLIQSAFDLGIKVHHHHFIRASRLEWKEHIVAEAFQDASSRPSQQRTYEHGKERANPGGFERPEPAEAGKQSRLEKCAKPIV